MIQSAQGAGREHEFDEVLVPGVGARAPADVFRLGEAATSSTQDCRL